MTIRLDRKILKRFRRYPNGRVAVAFSRVLRDMARRINLLFGGQ